MNLIAEYLSSQKLFIIPLIVFAFCIGVALVFSPDVLASAYSSIELSSTQSGNWAEVCCGDGCVIDTDYCLGDGNFSCCK